MFIFVFVETLLTQGNLRQFFNFLICIVIRTYNDTAETALKFGLRRIALRFMAFVWFSVVQRCLS